MYISLWSMLFLLWQRFWRKLISEKRKWKLLHIASTCIQENTYFTIKLTAMNFATETFPSSFLKVWYITSPSETLIKNKKNFFFRFFIIVKWTYLTETAGYLTSPYSITSESNTKVRRKKEIITTKRSSWLFDGFLLILLQEIFKGKVGE